MNKIAVILDFPGFYESCLSTGLDDAEERMVEDIAENHLVTTAQVADAVYFHSDYHKGFTAIAKAYVEMLAEHAEKLGVKIAYESMESPREYNFTTDRVHVTIEDPQALFDQVDQGDLAEVIKANFTSCDGFHSFYSNDVLEWLEKPLAEWDTNELGALLQAFLTTAYENGDIPEPCSDDMHEWLSEPFSTAVDEQTDWTALGKALGVEL